METAEKTAPKEKTKISIQRALTILKTIDVKITNKTRELNIAACIVPNEKYQGLYTPDAFKDRGLKVVQAIGDLMALRANLKASIYKSNAETVVTVAGDKMTVAQAIVRKEGLQFEKAFNTQVSRQISAAKASIATATDAAKIKTDAMVVAQFGKDAKKDSDEAQTVIKNFLKTNVPELILAIDEDRLQKLSDDVAAFEEDIDICLSESNALTQIEI